MSYGVTDDGWNPKTLEIIKGELEEEFRSIFGATINVSPQSRFGQIIGIMAEREAAMWELGEAIYNSATADGSTGVSLDNVAGLTGTVRAPATHSTGTVLAIGDVGTVLPVGRVVSVVSTEERFATTEAATLAAPPSWSDGVAYVIGDYIESDGAIWICVVGGTSHVDGQPLVAVGLSQTDGNGVSWDFRAEGEAIALVPVEAEETGEVVAATHTLTQIETAVSGWTFVTNEADAELGTAVETDAALRLRREDEISAGGSSNADAIRAAILELDGVVSCTVFVNDTNTTDGDGVPPHAIEVLVRGGDDQEIWDTIWATKSAGIQAYGLEVGTAEDAEGVDHAVAYSQPISTTIWVIANLTIDADEFPSNGADLVEAAILSFAAAQKTGKNVVASSLVAQCFTVAGVLDAAVLIGVTNPPVASTTIAISSRNLAVFDSARVTVNTTPGVP